jgi:hypothetical protein
MKKAIVIIAALMMSAAMFSQEVKQSICVLLVTKTDSSYVLECNSVKIEIPDEWFDGELTYVIVPQQRDSVQRRHTTLFMPPKEDWSYEK